MLLRYDAEKMKEMLVSFYLLTKIRIVVFNDAFEKIAEAPGHDSTFCRLLRKDPKARELCFQSDRAGCIACKQQNGLYSYTCHAGLSEMVTPIYYGNLIIGYLMFGQIMQHDDFDGYWPEIQKRCQSYDVDMEELYRTYQKIRFVRPEYIIASSRIMEACAGYLWLQRTVKLMEDTLPVEIDAYITENLRADLSIGALCRRFGISRSKLYGICKEYYGCGVEQLTRSLRIKKAKELLETTSLPVSAVSQQSGYDDYNYFIKVFKKDTGLTPGTYRKKQTNS